MLKYSTYTSIYQSHPTLGQPAPRIEGILRHRHVMTALLLIVLLFATGAGIIHAVAASSNHEASINYETVVVTSGDTLWNIAVAHKPSDMDTRKYVKRLKSLNHIQNSEIVPGDLLMLPAL